MTTLRVTMMSMGGYHELACVTEQTHESRGFVRNVFV